jgi:hypothetical protein
MFLHVGLQSALELLLERLSYSLLTLPLSRLLGLRSFYLNN